MSALASILIGAAAKAGAPLVRSVLERAVGRTGAELAGAVIDEVARRAGTEPKRLESLPPAEVEAAVAATEADMPAILAAWNDSQRLGLELQRAEMDRGAAWTWAWRPAAMWLTLVLWAFALLVQPLANAFGAGLSAPDLGMLMQFSGLYMALYMGGHTVKHIVDQWRAK